MEISDKELIQEMVKRGLSMPKVEMVSWCHDCNDFATFRCGGEWHNIEQVPKSSVVPATKARLR